VSEPRRPPADPVDAPAPAASTFDAAIAEAFRQELVDYSPEVKPAASAKPKPVTKFRTVEPDPASRRRAGGPVVELEASLVRELEPVGAVEVAESEPEEAEAAPNARPRRRSGAAPRWPR